MTLILTFIIVQKMANDMDFNLNDLVNICLPISLMWKKIKDFNRFQGSHTNNAMRIITIYINTTSVETLFYISNPKLLWSLSYALSNHGALFVKVERRPNRECVFISRLCVNCKPFLIKFSFWSAKVKKECRTLHTHEQT